MHIGRTIPPASAPLGFKEILDGLRGLVRGPREVERFRCELKQHFGVRHCFLVSSGKAALALILQALHDLQPQRDEVLVPAFCCYSVPSAIVRAGLKIRLCDSDPDTLDFDFHQLAGEILPIERPLKAACAGSNENLLAVVSVHLFGLAADTGRLRKLVSDPAVAVVEDAAQAMGAEFNGRKMGLIGDIGFFSLGRGKALSAVEGGIVVTNRDDLAEALKSRMGQVADYSHLELAALLAQGIALSLLQRPSLFWIPKTVPFLRVGDTIYDPQFRVRKFSPFQAGMTRNWRAKLKKYRDLRRQAAGRWAKHELPAGVSGYSNPQGQQADFIRYPLRIRKPGLWAGLLERSLAGGCGVMLTYPDSIAGIPELESRLNGQSAPAAGRLAKEILTLPVHPLLSAEDENRIELLLKTAETKSSCQCGSSPDDVVQRGILA
jgi:dTDP-4-amino-4,6-dideoxygalactose transaminase